MRERYYLAFRGSTGAIVEMIAGAVLVLFGVLADMTSLTAVGLFLLVLSLCVKAEEER